ATSTSPRSSSRLSNWDAVTLDSPVRSPNCALVIGPSVSSNSSAARSLSSRSRLGVPGLLSTLAPLPPRARDAACPPANAYQHKHVQHQHACSERPAAWERAHQPPLPTQCPADATYVYRGNAQPPPTRTAQPGLNLATGS